MLVIENVTINGKEFIKTYSDAGYMVECDGVHYSEAVDPVGFNRTYTETDELIETEPMSEVEEKAKAYDIITGVSE